jgi:hypothetical protein
MPLEEGRWREIVMVKALGSKPNSMNQAVYIKKSEEVPAGYNTAV